MQLAQEEGAVGDRTAQPRGGYSPRTKGKPHTKTQLALPPIERGLKAAVLRQGRKGTPHMEGQPGFTKYFRADSRPEANLNLHLGEIILNEHRIKEPGPVSTSH